MSLFEPTLSLSHLIDLLLVQVKDLPGGGSSDLLVGPVARLRAVPTIPGQHKHHLGLKEGAGEMRRRLPPQCLLSAHALPVSCKAALTPNVMLRPLRLQLRKVKDTFYQFSLEF